VQKQTEITFSKQKHLRTVSTQPSSQNNSPKNFNNKAKKLEFIDVKENSEKTNLDLKIKSSLIETNSDFVLEDKYEILRKLGEGSHAKVYLAKKRNSKSHVAIKVIKIKSLTSESKFSNLQNEIEIIKSLKKNPYTMELKNLIKDENHLYLVFSYVGSRNLAEFLTENPNLSVNYFYST
jgi:hypothetical protein